MTSIAKPPELAWSRAVVNKWLRISRIGLALVFFSMAQIPTTHLRGPGTACNEPDEDVHWRGGLEHGWCCGDEGGFWNADGWHDDDGGDDGFGDTGSAIMK
jgi:hypothetical protein